jgi:hypothetical protein
MDLVTLRVFMVSSLQGGTGLRHGTVALVGSALTVGAFVTDDNVSRDPQPLSLPV